MAIFENKFKHTLKAPLIGTCHVGEITGMMQVYSGIVEMAK